MLSLDGSTTTSSGSSDVTGQPMASDHQWPSVDGSAQSITTEYERVDTAAPLQPSWSRGNRRWRNGRVLRQPGRMQSFSHDGLTFDVTDRGPADGSVAILLHGFPQSADAWSDVVPYLTEAGVRTLAPDQRGYSPGARPSGRRSYRLALLAADILALADAAGVERFHVIGHDWGAAVAWELAARHPERVTSLTTLSVPHPRAFAASMVRSTQLVRSWYMLAFQIPRFERLVVRRQGAMLRRVLDGSGMPADRADPAFDRMMQPEAFGCALNWYRALPFGGGGLTPEVTVRRRTSGVPQMWP